MTLIEEGRMLDRGRSRENEKYALPTVPRDTILHIPQLPSALQFIAIVPSS